MSAYRVEDDLLMVTATQALVLDPGTWSARLADSRRRSRAHPRIRRRRRRAVIEHVNVDVRRDTLRRPSHLILVEATGRRRLALSCISL